MRFDFFSRASTAAPSQRPLADKCVVELRHPVLHTQGGLRTAEEWLALPRHVGDLRASLRSHAAICWNLKRIMGERARMAESAVDRLPPHSRRYRLHHGQRRSPPVLASLLPRCAPRLGGEMQDSPLGGHFRRPATCACLPAGSAVAQTWLAVIFALATTSSTRVRATGLERIHARRLCTC